MEYWFVKNGINTHKNLKKTEANSVTILRDFAVQTYRKIKSKKTRYIG